MHTTLWWSRVSTVSRKYLQTWKSVHHTPSPLKYHARHQFKSPERQEVVVLSQVLADEVNVGYEDFYYHIISEVNGEPIRVLSHFASLLDSAEDTLELRTSNHKWIILDPKLARASSRRDPLSLSGDDRPLWAQ